MPRRLILRQSNSVLDGFQETLRKRRDICGRLLINKQHPGQHSGSNLRCSTVPYLMRLCRGADSKHEYEQ